MARFGCNFVCQKLLCTPPPPHTHTHVHRHTPLTTPTPPTPPWPPHPHRHHHSSDLPHRFSVKRLAALYLKRRSHPNHNTKINPFFQVRLTKLTGTNNKDYGAQKWHEVTLDGATTSFVRTEVITVYTSGTSGFTEIEFYTGTSKLHIVDIVHQRDSMIVK